MVKVAIFLCVAIFAAISNASLEDTLEKAQQKLDNLIENTVESVTAVVDETKHKSAELTATIEAEANKHQKKLSEDVASKVQQALDDVAKITEEAGDVDVTECTKLGDELEASAGKALSEVRKCFSKNRVGAYVDNLLKASDKAIAELRGHQLDARRCLENRDLDFFSLAKTIACTNKVAAETAVTVAKAVPSVSIEATKLTLVLATLPAHLTACTSLHVVNTFYYDSSVITQKTSKCVQQKVEEAVHRKPDSAAFR